MTFEDSIKSMMETITEQTLNRRVVWQPSSNISMYVEIEDVRFTFTITWKLELKTGYSLSNGWISIKSNDFEFTIYSHDFPQHISKIREFLYSEYFHQYKPSEQDAIDKVENITKKISITEYRDKKINGILE
jgi:hypothetical protein